MAIDVMLRMTFKLKRSFTKVLFPVGKAGLVCFSGANILIGCLKEHSRSHQCLLGCTRDCTDL